MVPPVGEGRQERYADAAMANFLDGSMVIFKGELKDNTGRCSDSRGLGTEATGSRAREDGLPRGRTVIGSTKS